MAFRLLLTVLLLAAGIVRAADAGRGADEAAIGQLVAAQAAAWNAGDAHRFAAQFAPDGAFVNIQGRSFRGHDAFEQRHAEIFAGMFHGTQITLHIDRLAWLTADSAFAEVSTAVSGLHAPPPGVPPLPDGILRTRLIEVLSRSNGQWLIQAYYNVNELPGGPPARN
jgi:uncharacterized protein (TIGR02246 family)